MLKARLKPVSSLRTRCAIDLGNLNRVLPPMHVLVKPGYGSAFDSNLSVHFVEGVSQGEILCSM